MTTTISENRGRLWPIVFAIAGGLNIFEYFYEFSFQPENLLKGLGFLFMVPLAYLYPSALTFKLNHSRPPPPASWAKWLSNLGLALVISGFAVKWL